MTLTFGVDEPPAELPAGSWAYALRAPCGHVTVIRRDGDRGDAPLEPGTWERVLWQEIREEGLCACPKPEQAELFQ